MKLPRDEITNEKHQLNERLKLSKDAKRIKIENNR
jgi:hypothetical protein